MTFWLHLSSDIIWNLSLPSKKAHYRMHSIKKKTTLPLCVPFTLTLLSWPHICGFSTHQAILGYQPGVLQFNSAVTTYPEMVQIPQGKDSVAQNLLLQTRIKSQSCYLCFWPTGCQGEVSTPKSSGVVNLLQQLIKLRKMVYLSECQIIKKGTDK